MTMTHEEMMKQRAERIINDVETFIKDVSVFKMQNEQFVLNFCDRLNGYSTTY